MSTSRDELRSCLHGVNESGAGSGEIESPNPLCAELVLNQAGGRGEKHVGRDRADYDGVQVAWSQTALGKRFFGGLDREVTGGHAFFHDVAFADTDAGENPVIGGINHLFEVGVGEKSGRHIGAEGTDLGAERLAQSMSLQCEIGNAYFAVLREQCPTLPI